MARLWTNGFGLGARHADGFRTDVGVDPTYDAANARTGPFAAKIPSGSAAGSFLQRDVTGVLGRRYWFRTYFKRGTGTPSLINSIIEVVDSGGHWSEIDIGAVGGTNFSWQRQGGGVSTDLGVACNPGQWYLLEYGVTHNSDGSASFEVWIDGVQRLSTTAGSGFGDALSYVRFGADAGNTTEFDNFYADQAINDDQGSDQNGRPGPGRVYTLRPTGDGTAGGNEANWTKPGGATTNKFSALDNAPPVYASDSTNVADAEKFIRNPTNAIAALTLALQTYTAAGVAAGGTIKLTQPVVITGSASNSDTAGTITSQANPADAGQSITTFDNGPISSSPTTWVRQTGITTYNPSVTRGTAPQIRLSRAASALTVMTNAVALLVDVDETPADAYGKAVWADSPVRWYRGAGQTEYSAGATGTAVGTPAAGTGVAANSDGTSTINTGQNDYYTHPDETITRLGNIDFTVEFWLKFPSSFTSGSSFPGLLGKGTGASGGWTIYTQSSREIFFKAGGNPPSNAIMGLGERAHIAFVYTAADGHLKCYKNGVLTQDNSGFTPPTGANTSSLQLGHGAEATNGLAGVELDEVAIYTTALSQARLQAHVLAGTTTIAADFAGSGGLTASLSTGFVSLSAAFSGSGGISPGLATAGATYANLAAALSGSGALVPTITTITPSPPAPIPPPPLPPPPFMDRTQWAVILCDINGVPLSNITTVASEKRLIEVLNQPKSFTFSVPSDHAKIVTGAADGAPYLDYIRRTVKAYRYEYQYTGQWAWVLRFVGYVWPLTDTGDEETQTTQVTCFDPLIMATKRLVRDSAGSFVKVPFTTTDAAQILKTIWDRTNSFSGGSGVTTAGGSFPTTSNVSVEWRYKKMSDALSELTAGIDIALMPNDSQVRAHGILNAYVKRGQDRPNAIFSWKAPPHTLAGIVRTMDPTDAANVIVGLGSAQSGAQLTATATDATSVGNYLQLEEIVTFSDVKDQTHLNALVATELLKRRPPQEAITVTPFDGLVPYQDYDVGDYVYINAHPDLRGGVLQRQERLYGMSISIDDEDNETVEVVTQKDT